MPKRVLVIGLDGATLNLVRPWAAAGKLPNLARLMAEGASGPLRSTIHPLSAQAWSSFMTGKNMGKHGLVDFHIKRPGTYQLQPVNAKSRDGRTIWSLLSEMGKKVGVINVPMTYPPDQVNGFLISGMDAPTLNHNFTYPPELKQELLRAVPDYQIEAGGHNLVRGRVRRYQPFREEMLRVERARFAAARYLMERYPWDFFIVVFRSTDRAQHWFWKHMDPHHPRREPGDEKFADTLLQVYQELDQMLGDFLADLPPDTTVVIMSDHGAAPMGSRVIALNPWLRDQGFLTYKAPRTSSAHGMLWNLYTVLRRSLPSGTKRWLKGLFPQLERRIFSSFGLAEIDWSQTRAYSVEPREAIWINVKSREPQGIVEPGEEYERTRQEISDRLLAWRDAETGLKIVERVYKREELYHGPYIERIPDLLVLLSQNGYHYQTTTMGPTQRSRAAIEDWRTVTRQGFYSPNGGHDLDGLCIFWGPDIIPGAETRGAHIIDMAPTLLHLLNQPIPEDMDGRVLEEIFTAEFQAAHPVTKRAAEATLVKELEQRIYSEEETKEIEERLRGLGYMD